MDYSHMIPVGHTERPHLAAPTCWCRPSLRWLHEIEAHNGPLRRVWSHTDPLPAPPSAGETK